MKSQTDEPGWDAEEGKTEIKYDNFCKPPTHHFPSSAFQERVHMKKNVILLLLLMLWVVTAYASRPTAILGPGIGGTNFRVPGHESIAHRVLSKDTTYILTGWFFIDSLHDLTIPPGTLIRGDSASGGSLIIRRGARIFAEGTRENPIVFTSNKPAGTRVPGDWGGVLLLGNAPTNQPHSKNIEGGFGTIPNTDASYGGYDPHDNSGVLKYVRIEFAGIAFAQDNEINGLTLGGVGDGTVLDYIQTSFANDDDVEMFGGSVNMKHYVGWRMLDDDIDTDEGYSGRIQFAYEVRDPNIFDASAAGSSEGFESDGEPPTATPAVFPDYPHTNARVSNITIIGPVPDTNTSVNAKWTCVARLRRGTQWSVYNSLLVGYPQGIDIRDTLTQRGAMQDTLQISHTSIQAKRQVIFADASPSTPGIGFDPTAWFNDPSKKNIGGTGPRQPVDAGVPTTAFHLDNTNNGIPAVGSEPDTAGTSFQGRIAGDAFFDSVSYRGAFDPHLPRNQQWDWGWTNYDPQNYDPEAASTVALNMASGWNMISIPFRDFSSFALSAVFPTAVPPAYGWQSGYISYSSIERGKGYWLKFHGDQTINMTGLKSVDDTIQVGGRWNMIGSVAESVSVGNIISNPPGNISSPYYGYDGGYSPVSSLQPGKAYWVKASATGTLILNGFLANQLPKQSTATALDLGRVNTLTVSDNSGHTQKLYFTELSGTEQSLDQYETPPVPPLGSFDVRFASQRTVASFSSAVLGAHEFPIQVQSSSYPVTIKADIRENSHYALEEVENGKTTAVHTLTAGSTVTIPGNSAKSLVLKIVNEQSVPPRTFALGRNYPNPFNPSTRIEIQVPQNSRVKVAVYNVLGQEVASLLDDVVTAGYHTIEWNAQTSTGVGASSGIYFVRMTSGTFSSMRKIMLMK
jgi:hypothetical protein